MSYGFISDFSQNMLWDYFNRETQITNNYAYNNRISKLVEQDNRNMSNQQTKLTLALAVSGLESNHSKKLIEYFQDNSQRNTRIDQLISSAGLGIYNGISDIDLARYDQPDLTKEEKVYLALTYAIIGNHQRAETLLVELLNQYFVVYNGIGYLDFGSKDIDQHYTALAGIIASKLQREEYKLICGYLQKEKILSGEIELLKTWLSKEILENNIGFANLTYSLDGYEVETVIDLRENTFILKLNDSINTLEIKENPENLQFMLRGSMDKEEAIEKHVDSINVRKYYDVGDKIKQGDTITVYVEIDITDNQHKVFNVTDSIPTGFAYVTDSLENGVLDVKDERLLTITAVGESDLANVIILKYNILALNVGKVRTEEAIVSSYSDDKFGYSGTGVLTVVED